MKPTKQSLMLIKTQYTFLRLGNYEASIGSNPHTITISHLPENIETPQAESKNQITVNDLEDANAITVLVRLAKAELFKKLNATSKQQQLENLRSSLLTIEVMLDDARLADNFAAMGKLAVQKHTLQTDLELYESLDGLYKLAGC
jgi:PHP family Zn ribbon phosphoesterase